MYFGQGYGVADMFEKLHTQSVSVRYKVNTTAIMFLRLQSKALETELLARSFQWRQVGPLS